MSWWLEINDLVFIVLLVLLILKQRSAKTAARQLMDEDNVADRTWTRTVQEKDGSRTVHTLKLIHRSEAEMDGT